tara:strand:- start:194 stop:349 length:156 start_codon:yes stop_codon:yes gene_type:complete
MVITITGQVEVVDLVINLFLLLVLEVKGAAVELVEVVDLEVILQVQVVDVQ